MAIDHAALVRDPDLALGAACDGLLALARRRLKHEPVSRILGQREFFGEIFEVSPDVLDPRPDTETLIEAALEVLAARREAPLRILDLGVGSGAILATLLRLFPRAYGIGVDLSLSACRMAQKNIYNLRLNKRGQVVCADWAQALGGQFDLIVSNPPYIVSAEIETLAPDVREHDPHLALDGGADGLAAYRLIASAAAARLAPDGWILFELGVGQFAAVDELLQAAGFAAGAARADLAGHARVVMAQHHGANVLTQSG